MFFKFPFIYFYLLLFLFVSAIQLAVYGMGWVRDERLHRAYLSGKVSYEITAAAGAAAAVFYLFLLSLFRILIHLNDPLLLTPRKTNNSKWRYTPAEAGGGLPLSSASCC